MPHLAPFAVLFLLGLSIHGTLSQDDDATTQAPSQTPESPQAEEESDWGMNALRGSFEAVNGYFDSMLELMGGRDGVCQYHCRYGELAQVHLRLGGIPALDTIVRLGNMEEKIHMIIREIKCYVK